MERISHFVLFATITVSCYCYSIPTLSELESEIPPEPQDLDEVYPAEYIAKLKAALSPEEREKFFPTSDQETDVEDRVYESKNCKYSLKPKILRTKLESAVKNEDRMEFFVAYPSYLFIEVCEPPHQNQTWRNRCDPGTKEIGIVGCCVHKENPKKMTVLNVPVEEYKQRIVKENEKDHFVIKMMYIENECSCSGSEVLLKEKDTYECPRYRFL